MIERDKLGKFIKGHTTLPNWGFQPGNKINIGNHSLKGKRVSPITEFKKGMIPWNKGEHHSLEQRKKMVKNHKGMTGLHHSLKTREKIGLKHLGNITSDAARIKQSKARITFLKNFPQKNYSQAKGGWRIINGRKQYFRSRWEANAARLLDFQKRKWEYETKTFWFEKIKRGTRTYLPDFFLPEENIFIEVKGWMDPESLTKLKRMKKYYPQVKIEIWDSDFFKTLKKQGIPRLVPEWE